MLRWDEQRLHVWRVLRLVFAFGFSYLHPDEYFQGPEIAHGDVHGVAVPRTWEFTSDAPIRSIVPIWVFQAPPMLLARSPAWMLLATRLWHSGLVNVMEYLVAGTGGDPLLFSTSFTAYTFLQRPLSNSHEALLVLLSLFLITKRRYGLLGIVLALGIFTRISFSFFIAPAMLRHVVKTPRSVVPIALSGSIVVAAIVYVDSLYYGKLTIAPLNNVRYNSDAQNLAQHGLHPHWQHIVHLAMLLGPLPLFARWSWRDVRVQCALAGFFMLSIAPHQEARFLLPTDALLLSSARLRSTRYFGPLWLGYNLLLGVFFGWLHQAQVPLAALWVGQNYSAATSITWLKTYPSPSMLLQPGTIVTHLYGAAATATDFVTDLVVAPRSADIVLDGYRLVKLFHLYVNLDDLDVKDLDVFRRYGLAVYEKT